VANRLWIVKLFQQTDRKLNKTESSYLSLNNELLQTLSVDILQICTA
jgi:hypothetical protein